jgi:hypothetical protein
MTRTLTLRLRVRILIDRMLPLHHTMIEILGEIIVVLRRPHLLLHPRKFHKIISVIRHLLEVVGFQICLVLTVLQGEATLRSLAHHHLDYILVDQLHLRTLQATQHPPITHLRRQGVAVGSMDMFVQKFQNHQEDMNPIDNS